MCDSPSPSPSLEEAQLSSNHSSSVSSSPSHTERTAETTRMYSLVYAQYCGRFNLFKNTYIYILFIFYFLSCNRSYKSVNNLFALYVFSPDPLHDGLSSSHSVLGHSPGLVQGGRDTDVTSVEYNKENKRSHSDRGKTVSAWSSKILKSVCWPHCKGQFITAFWEYIV